MLKVSGICDISCMGNVGAIFETGRGMQRCRARLVLVTCDLPARAMLLCMKNHNGISACCYCYHPGMTIGDDHLHRYWPYDSTFENRTHESMKQDVITATATHSAVCTVFFFFCWCILSLCVITLCILLQCHGMLPVVSPLLAAPGFNMVDGVAIDYMHVVCLGIVRSLLDIWLNE